MKMTVAVYRVAGINVVAECDNPLEFSRARWVSRPVEVEFEMLSEREIGMRETRRINTEIEEVTATSALKVSRLIKERDKLKLEN